MTEIAMRAGFGSLRRFNSVFAEIYGRSPTEIRRMRRSADKAEQTVLETNRRVTHAAAE
jgi:transcriptional regulator GlxA family with amidase domain